MKECFQFSYADVKLVISNQQSGKTVAGTDTSASVTVSLIMSTSKRISLKISNLYSDLSPVPVM